MTINRTKPSGWIYRDEFESVEANAIDVALTKALDKTAAGDTLSGRIVLSGGGRFAQSVFAMPNADTTLTVGNGNTIVEIGATVTANRTLSLSTTGVVSGEIISVFADPEFLYTVTVTASGATYEIGNGQRADGPWAAFIYAAGSWRLYQQAQGSRLRKEECVNDQTFVVPRGVTQLLLYGYGGGGGGGNGGDGNFGSGTVGQRAVGGGGSGGGGSLARWQTVSVTALQSYSVAIGQSAPASNGGDTLLKQGSTVLASFKGGRAGASGRTALQVQQDRADGVPSPVPTPGVPYEFWNSYQSSTLSIADRDASFFSVPSAGGTGGVYTEAVTPPPYEVQARYGVDSPDGRYTAGLPGKRWINGAASGNSGAAGGGGGAGPGGNGGNGGDSLAGEFPTGSWPASYGQSASTNTGAGGGGSSGACNTLSVPGGYGGSGKLVIYYVK